MKFSLATGCLAAALFLSVPALAPQVAFAQAKPLETTAGVAELEAIGPLEVAGYADFDPAAFRAVCAKIAKASASTAYPPETEGSPELLQRVTRLEAQKARVDLLLKRAYEKRVEIAAHDFGAARDRALTNYLQRTLALIDLAGRINADAATLARTAVTKAAAQPAPRAVLLAFYDKNASAHGAIAFAPHLVDPAPNNPNRKALSAAEKLKVIDLIGRSGRLEAIPLLTEVLNLAEDSPEVLLRAVDAVRALGVPQDPRPGQGADVPEPPVLASEVLELLKFLPPEALSQEQAKHRKALVDEFTALASKGLSKASYRLGSVDVQPGDWILTYNPSPYNLFTNLSPGLYTHVGVVALEAGVDGKRRMVVVEVLEHDKIVLSTNVDAYVDGVTRYALLRSDDAAAAEKMAQVAASIIGNPAEFDLTFQTKNIERYKGQKLKGVKIKSYCAGIPLLCAQETSQPRSYFFPIEEHPAGAYLQENLERLGMSIGEDFVTPTGPLFSANMQLVGWKAPVHDAQKEIEERVFDHFALSLIERPLTPNPDLYQSLRLRMARAAQGNPLLAQAMAAAAGVHADMDLVAGAKAAAVVETLDEIAYTQSGAYRDVFGALGPGTPAELARLGRSPQEIQAITAMRNRVPELWTQVSTGKMTRGALKAYLVEHYTKTGRTAIDSRFFPPTGAATTKVPAGK